jgi:hypothetical protein
MGQGITNELNGVIAQFEKIEALVPTVIDSE